MKNNIKFCTFLFKFFFWLLLLAQKAYSANGEFLTYSIIKGNTTIGTIRIERNTTNEFTQYICESNAKVRMLLSFEVYDKMSVLFRGTQLLQAKLYRTLNGKVKVNNIATWNGNSYHLSDKEGLNGSIKHPIHLTTASLYYFEPGNVTAVFSEKFQKMIPIKRVGDKKYLMNLPDGNKVTYSYVNGICTLVEADTEWASLKFVLNTNKTTKN